MDILDQKAKLLNIVHFKNFSSSCKTELEIEEEIMTNELINERSKSLFNAINWTMYLPPYLVNKYNFPADVLRWRTMAKTSVYNYDGNYPVVVKMFTTIKKIVLIKNSIKMNGGYTMPLDTFIKYVKCEQNDDLIAYMKLIVAQPNIVLKNELDEDMMIKQMIFENYLP